MGSLKDLPVEILARVFSYLSSDELLGVELVCQRWSDIVDEFAWKQKHLILPSDLGEYWGRERVDVFTALVNNLRKVEYVCWPGAELEEEALNQLLEKSHKLTIDGIGSKWKHSHHDMGQRNTTSTHTKSMMTDQQLICLACAPQLSALGFDDMEAFLEFIDRLEVLGLRLESVTHIAIRRYQVIRAGSYFSSSAPDTSVFPNLTSVAMDSLIVGGSCREMRHMLAPYSFELHLRNPLFVPSSQLSALEMQFWTFLDYFEKQGLISSASLWAPALDLEFLNWFNKELEPVEFYDTLGHRFSDRITEILVTFSEQHLDNLEQLMQWLLALPVGSQIVHLHLEGYCVDSLQNQAKLEAIFQQAHQLPNLQRFAMVLKNSGDEPMGDPRNEHSDSEGLDHTSLTHLRVMDKLWLPTGLADLVLSGKRLHHLSFTANLQMLPSPEILLDGLSHLDTLRSLEVVLVGDVGAHWEPMMLASLRKMRSLQRIVVRETNQSAFSEKLERLKVERSRLSLCHVMGPF